MRIITGISNNGAPSTMDYNEAKACNFCINFKGYGLHAVAGHCFKLNKDIEGGYIGNYHKVAKDCDFFECIPKLLLKD